MLEVPFYRFKLQAQSVRGRISLMVELAYKYFKINSVTSTPHFVTYVGI